MGWEAKVAARSCPHKCRFLPSRLGGGNGFPLDMALQGKRDAAMQFARSDKCMGTLSADHLALMVSVCSRRSLAAWSSERPLLLSPRN